jgi:hypothetical protein
MRYLSPAGFAGRTLLHCTAAGCLAVITLHFRQATAPNLTDRAHDTPPYSVAKEESGPEMVPRDGVAQMLIAHPATGKHRSRSRLPDDESPARRRAAHRAGFRRLSPW